MICSKCGDTIEVGADMFYIIGYGWLCGKCWSTDPDNVPEKANLQP